MKYNELHQRIAEEINAWFPKQCQGGHYYLYFRAVPDGDIRITDTAPAGYELATAQQLSAAMDKRIAQNWVYKNCQRLPIIDEA